VSPLLRLEDGAKGDCWLRSRAGQLESVDKGIGVRGVCYIESRLARSRALVYRKRRAARERGESLSVRTHRVIT
jgi:hypothetical protein